LEFFAAFQVWRERLIHVDLLEGEEQLDRGDDILGGEFVDGLNVCHQHLLFVVGV